MPSEAVRFFADLEAKEVCPEVKHVVFVSMRVNEVVDEVTAFLTGGVF